VGDEVGDIDAIDQGADDALLFDEQSAACGFGGVRGHDGHDLDAGEKCPEGVGADALCGEGAQGVLEPASLAGGRAQGVAAAANAVHAFGQIHQLEIGRKGPHQLAGVLG